jgi:hypothetical protein
MRENKFIFIAVFVSLFLVIGLGGSTAYDLVFDSSDDTISMQHNRTENTNSSLGIRLSAPILSMTFDTDNESGGYVRDGSVYNNFGTNSGATFNSSCGTTSAGNDLGGCYRFDGTTSINIEDQAALDFACDQPFSFALWVNPDNADGFDNLFDKSDGSHLGYYAYWYAADGRIAFSFGDSSAGRMRASTDTTVNIGSWNHVVINYDGSNAVAGITFYINGELVADTDRTSGTPSTCVNSNPLQFANGTLGFSEAWMDELRIFNRTLSADEISKLYNGTKNNTNYWGKT